MSLANDTVFLLGYRKGPTNPDCLIFIQAPAGMTFNSDLLMNGPTATSLANVALTGGYSDLSGCPTLGTASAQASTAFATAAQGALAASAVQPATLSSYALTSSLGTAAFQASSVFASAAQGLLAASAVQAGSPPLVVTGTTMSISAATDSAAGSMSAADKTKLDAILAWSFSAPTFLSVTTSTQLSATRNAFVSYTFNASVTISLLAGQSITVTLKYADNVGMSTNVVTLPPAVTSNSGVLGLTQVNSLNVFGIIPAGKYRQVTFAVTNSATAPTSLAGGQEVLQ